MHAPGPWTVTTKRGPLHDIGATDPPAIKDSNGEYIAVLGGGSVHFANARAHADFILRACNSHDALVAALVLYVKLDNDKRSGCRIRAEDWAECHQAATRALAKARGE